MLNWRRHTRRKEVELYSEVILLKTIQDLMQHSLKKGHQHHKWHPPRSWISSPDCRDAQDKQRTQYLLTQVKMEDAPKLLKIPKSESPDIWIRLPRPRWPKSWSSMQDPVVPLERKFYGHHIQQDCCVNGNSRKFSWSTVGKFSKMFFRTPWKRDVLICVCGWHQIGWKETKHWSDVESVKQRSWFWRTNIIPWSCIPGMHSKTMWNKQRYCGQLHNHVWITNCRGENWKITILGKSVYLFVVLWYGRSCQEMCGSILWVGKQENRFISYIHQTCEYKQYCHVGNTAKQCRLGLLQDSDFGRDLEDSKSTSDETLCVFGSHTFVPISWMRKKQTCVCHTVERSLKFFSLDAGSRMCVQNQIKNRKTIKHGETRCQVKHSRNNWILRLTLHFSRTCWIVQCRFCLLKRAFFSHTDMFPRPTELLLTGHSTELIWTPRSKSNTSTPKTNSQTLRP